MKTALTLTCSECQNPALLQTIRTAGFTGINFTYDDTLFAAADPEALLQKIKDNLDAAGLSCPQAILPGRGRLAACDYSEPETEKRIAFALRTMPVLGAKWGALQPLSAVNNFYCKETAMTDNLARFGKYLAIAAQYGVGIAVENPLPLQEQEVQLFCAEPEELLEFVDRLNQPNAGICWNIGHANHLNHDCFGRDVNGGFDHTAAIRLLGSRIRTVHASDNFGDGHWRLPPGVGKLDWFKPLQWGSLLRALLQTGFTGSLTLDCDLEQGRRFPGLEEAYITLCAESAAAYAEEAEQG